MNKNVLKKMIMYGLYPVLLFLTIFTGWEAIYHHWDYMATYGIMTFITVIVLIIFETIFPLKKEWSMTKNSFWRDLKYIGFNATVIFLTKASFGFFAIYLSKKNLYGFFRSTPLIPSIIIFLLVFEFFQYWYHRVSHSANGRIGIVLWKIHVAHHLPDRVYVIMHAVFHPINAIVTTILIQATLLFLGINSEATLMIILFIDLQTLISHFNCDIKTGFLNYILIGTETHRYHHSAGLSEAKNFGTTLTIWDLIFGTFYCNCSKIPNRLGVVNPDSYPKSNSYWKVFFFPFNVCKNILNKLEWNCES